LQRGKLEERRVRDDKSFVLALLNISAGSLSFSCASAEDKIFYCLALRETINAYSRLNEYDTGMN